MKKFRVLIIGSGGREHAIAWSIFKNKDVEKIFCCPGNGGTHDTFTNVEIDVRNHDHVVSFIEHNLIDLTVVGPEDPLADGIVDSLKSKGLIVFGPSQYCSQLESSKLFARNLMKEVGIPHPKFFECSNRQEILNAKKILGLPLVLKADGLAAGKGVIICSSDKEIDDAIDLMLNQKAFGSASSKISVEECLMGEEVSVFAICNDKNYQILNTAQDHKRAYDGDLGPNTGGMGAYSPTLLVDDMMMHEVQKDIIEPTLHALSERNNPYCGFLYCGLMIVDGKPYVIEYNVRMGDPEAQVVIPLLKESIFDILWCCANNKELPSVTREENKTAVSVVISSDGYPGSYDKGKIIKGLNESNDNLIFHSGTVKKNDEIYTNGGRVLNVVGFGEDLKSAIDDAYMAIKQIDFSNKFFRKDIGLKGLNYQRVKDDK